MKTAKLILHLLLLTAISLGQTQSPDSTAEAQTSPAETGIATTESLTADTLASTVPDELAGAELDSSATSPSETLEDSLTEPGPEMVMVPNEPQPITVAGLMNEGWVYYWSNDHLKALNLARLPYLTIQDPVEIAIKANDCLDIVCHLLASDSTGLNYVIVGVTDSSAYKVYDTVTKVVVLEALKDSLATELDRYLRSISGGILMPLAVASTKTSADTLKQSNIAEQASEPRAPGDRQSWLQIKRRNFRSMDELFTNPANLARNFPAHFALILPNFKIGVRNSLLTPGWYKKWWTTGGTWDDDTKSEYLATLQNKELVLNITPEFQSILGFRLGRFGFNLSGKSHVRLILPGSIPTTLIPILPMERWTLNEPIENGGLELETIPFVLKSTFSYAHPLDTPYGNVKIGVALNLYQAAGYMNIVSDNLTVTFSEDSVFAYASGEGWATTEGIGGHIDTPDFNDFDPLSTLSDPTLGLDLGAIMDLYDLLHQEVELQISIRNIAAKYSWSGLTHEAWTFEQRMPLTPDTDTDSLEQYQEMTTTVIESQDSYDINIPTVLNVAAFYQPISRVLIGVGIEKAFTDEVRFGYSPDLEIYYQLNYFTTKWLDLSYYHRTKYGEPVHTFGTGLHFGHYDAGITFSLYNGLNSEARGIGFGVRSSLHF